MAVALTVVCALLPQAHVKAEDATMECDDPGTAMPVVLVHGFSVPGDHPFEQLAGELRRHQVDFAPVLFDYRGESTRWVADARIGPRLRRLIICLADASLEAGGIGRVAVVAHSMGGLATRLALSDDVAGADAALIDEVALVATLGTPHTGSLLAGPATEQSLVARAFHAELSNVISVIGPPSVDNAAGDALAPGSRQLSALPVFPPGVPVFAGAGEFVATARLFFYERDVRIGDAVVSSSSATAVSSTVDQLGGTEIVECQTLLPLDLGVTAGALGGGAAVAGATAGAMTAALNLTMLTNPDFLDCYHGHLTTSRQHLDPIIAQLAAASARPPRTSTSETCTDAPATRDVERISQCLYEAWRDGDRETASAVAWPHVVDELFALTPGPPWEFLGCEQFSCTYVEPAPGEVHGVQIKFDVFADIDGDGLWYVHTMEILG